jgi:hypothetical protein
MVTMALIITASISVILAIAVFVYHRMLKHVKSQARRSQNEIAGTRIALTKAQDELSVIRHEAIHSSLFRSIQHMDDTCNVYTDENEANRELTSCLKVLGHHALYQHALDGHRTVDIFIDGCAIVEGKLDLQQGDTDRLIGQIEDYTKSPYHIYIVIYGKTSSATLDRITNQILNKYPAKVSLVHLPDAKRNKRQ